MSALSNWPASAPVRSPACCCPTWAPMSSASTVPAPSPAATRPIRRRAMRWQRGRRSIGVDLKNPDGVETILRLVESADVLIEGFRPGVTERLGIGPDECFARNPEARLRPHDGMGPGRSVRPGRRSRHQLHRPRRRAASDRSTRRSAGATAEPRGRLRRRRDVPRLRRGVRALLEAKTSGQGQVVDAAMVDGAALLTAMFHGMKSIGIPRPGARHQPARHRRALLRRRTSAPTASTSRSVRSSRSSTPSSCGSAASTPIPT